MAHPILCKTFGIPGLEIRQWIQVGSQPQAGWALRNLAKSVQHRGRYSNGLRLLQQQKNNVRRLLSLGMFLYMASITFGGLGSTNVLLVKYSACSGCGTDRCAASTCNLMLRFSSGEADDNLSNRSKVWYA
jgi:hypothetical protein